MRNFIIVLASAILLPILADVFDSIVLSLLSLIANLALVITSLVRLFSKDVAQPEQKRLLVLILCIISGSVIFGLSSAFPNFILFRIILDAISSFYSNDDVVLLFLLIYLYISNMVLWAIIKFFWCKLRWSVICYACISATFLSILPGTILYFWLKSLLVDPFDFI